MIATQSVGQAGRSGFGRLDLSSRVLALDMESLTDNSSVPKTLTLGGAAVLSSVQAKWGTQSLECNNTTSDFLTVTAHAAFSLPIFTICGWVYLSAAAAATTIIPFVDLGSYITGFSTRLRSSSATTMITYWNSASNSLESTTTAFSAATWYFVALTRDRAGNLRQFKLDPTTGIVARTGLSTGVTQALSSPTVRVGGILAGGANAGKIWIDDLVIANRCWFDRPFRAPSGPLAGAVH